MTNKCESYENDFETFREPTTFSGEKRFVMWFRPMKMKFDGLVLTQTLHEDKDRQ